ncbi:hypothetical protein ACH5RR_030682 [Cinchona calisaya]|uniref:RNA-binding protein 25 n=1 Tax=Cinchona calisaya TaxID=153742 RepID=A0ABD2YVB4_9GENT
MAEPSSSTSSETPTTTAAEVGEPNSMQSKPDNLNTQFNQPDPRQSSTPPPNPNPNLNPTTPPPPPIMTSLIAPPSIQPYAPVGGAAMPPTAPSFRPATAPLLQFSPVPLNPSYQNPVGVPPPGVTAQPQIPGMLPTAPPSVTGTGQVPVASSVPPIIPPLHYALPSQPIRAPFARLPNGYPAIPQPLPQGVVPPPGIFRYPSPYLMPRPAYLQRPLAAAGVIPPLSRPPVAGVRPPIIPLVVRPAVIPSVASTEKQTTVYVGKIASTVENDFILSLLQLCGTVKSWKRPQNPTNGTFKGFGFCEFESAEGVLCALRLLSKLNIDGQELVLNVDQATRDYLEDFVRKKDESLKNLKETETESTKTDGVVSGDEKNETPKPPMESPKSATEDSEKDDNDTKNKEKSDTSNFGLVTDEDRKGDQASLQKLTELIEERLKNKPLPPPPAQITADGSPNSNLEGSARSKDGEMDANTTKDAVEDKNENEMTSESKPSGEQDRSEASSPDRDRRHDKKSRDRDRDLKREKERELERYEREREQERAKREKEREHRIRDDERRFKAREKEWEAREKEREHWRKREREREKNRAQERKSEITNQERESDDGYSKKRKYRNSEEERRRRQREKEEDLADRLKEEEEEEEEEEVAEAKRMAAEEQKKKQQEEDLSLLSGNGTNGSDGGVLPEENNLGSKDKAVDQISDHDLGVIGDVNVQNGIGVQSSMASLSANDARQNSNAPSRKLGFGLQGSGKRTTVPSVFGQDEDEDMHKEKKMRPLVPIDYSTEEQLAVQSSVSEAPPSNLVAATESARRISNFNPKDERPDLEKERSRRSHDRSSQRDRDRNGDDVTRTREENRKDSLDRDRVREAGADKVKAPDNQKLLDAKQLIDMIPKTKDELFSYEINWATYDKNALHERMRPWISKKITEFLGEEEPTLVEYIMSSTREHVEATEMLNRLHGILDEEAEMFVLKMWRMLIFEIKRVETGLALRSRA